MVDSKDRIFEYHLHLSELPAEIHVYLLTFIRLCDVLSLGSTCKHFYKLTRLNSVWKFRFKTTTDHLARLLETKSSLDHAADEINEEDEEEGVWKEFYLKSCYAVSFARGNAVLDLLPEAPGYLRNLLYFKNGSYTENTQPCTIEAWVRVNRDKPGGVIIGCQSSSIRSHEWPQMHWQVMHVGPDGCIRGAIEPYYHLKGPMINNNQWHHIALTSSGNGHVKMYVDGILVNECDDPGRHQSVSMYHASMMDYCQVGTGCISYGDLTPYDENAMPHGHCGWYPFHGLVREVRFWSGILTENKIKERMHIQRIDLLEHGFNEHQKLIGYWPLSKLVPELNCKLYNDLLHLSAACVKDRETDIPLELTKVIPPLS